MFCGMVPYQAFHVSEKPDESDFGGDDDGERVGGRVIQLLAVGECDFLSLNHITSYHQQHHHPWNNLNNRIWVPNIGEYIYVDMEGLMLGIIDYWAFDISSNPFIGKKKIEVLHFH